MSNTSTPVVVPLCLALWVLVPGRLPAQDRADPVDFYGRRVSVLKMFGQTRWGECSPGRVDGTKIYHAAGVLVDRSRTPNAVYVADTGNNRILGFRSIDSKAADLVFGQPDASSGAPNGDCNTGIFGKPTRTSLCLINVPGNTNLAEQWMRMSFDVDAAGNLYVPDFGNNRVLVYRDPFGPDKAGGKGDAVPDLVIGQDDFTSHGVNRGLGPAKRDARSLYLSYGGFDHVSARGVSVDGDGNVWVADTFNYRVLRFPRGKATADLVLGQPDFTTSEPVPDIKKAPLNRTCTPTLARINPGTGELWVVDEYPGEFPARLLVFKPPFKSGMAADRVVVPRQESEGDYKDGYRFTHCTGLVFNPVKTDDWIDPATKAHRYRDGVVWVHDADRTLLLDDRGEILLAVGATDPVSRGWSDRAYGVAGADSTTPFRARWPGGMIGFDSGNRIYLADEAFHRVARYDLPWRPRDTPKGPALPEPDGGLFAGTLPNTVGPAHVHADRVGAVTFQGQLIVRDHQRYMVWTDYLTKPTGAPADAFVGQPGGTAVTERNHILGRAMHAIDHKDRLWATGEHGRLMAYQLPLKAGARPLRELAPVYWADEPEKEVDYHAGQAIAFEPAAQALWVFDDARHRLLRVRVPDDPAGKLLVDAVVGQANKTDGKENRGRDRPDAASFGDVNDVRFDRAGNLFVVDNTYELHANGRIVAFLAADLKAMEGMFPDVRAKRVYVAGGFDEPVGRRNLPPGLGPHSPVCVAFNRRNEMVVGNDGYFPDPKARNVHQLYLYRKPLERPTPDAVIQLPLGAPGEVTFDDKDNLVVQDHTYNKVWAINLDRDPGWLRPLRCPAGPDAPPRVAGRPFPRR
jgi:hypothetical protein